MRGYLIEELVDHRRKELIKQFTTDTPFTVVVSFHISLMDGIGSEWDHNITIQKFIYSALGTLEIQIMNNELIFDTQELAAVIRFTVSSGQLNLLPIETSGI